MSNRKEIVVIDYRMGNIASVRKAFSRIGCPSVITADHQRIREAAGMVLPGVGAFRDGIRHLKERGLIPLIKELVTLQKPFLGICIGMHLLMEEGTENGLHHGLGVLKGSVVRFGHNLKIPQIGWNTLTFKHSSPLFKGVEEGTYFYFVHSYHVQPADSSVVSTVTDYGYPFVSSITKGNLFATQFHPEKSQKAGLKILRNFADICFSNYSGGTT